MRGMRGAGGRPGGSSGPVVTQQQLDWLNSWTSVPWVPGNALYLRADKGITSGGGLVSAWADQSQTGDSNKNAAQATDGNKPAAPAADAGLNGQLSLVFGANSIMPTGTWTSPLTSPYTIMIIGYKPVAAGNKYAFDNFEVGHNVLYSSDLASGGSMSNDGTTLVAGPNVTIGSIVLCSFDGASSKLYVNAVTAVGSGATGTRGFTGMNVGNLKSGGQGGWNISDVGVWNHALTTSERLALFNYANARYAISIGG